MCSIFGYISSKSVNPDIFQQYLTHRGPDGHGIFKDDKTDLILGHGRLSIIDLSNSADQPMIDDDGNLILVFNGEIYNYLEIKADLSKRGHTFRTHSDTEVLLKAYKEFGKNCLTMLRGMFAFAIYDKQQETLFLARDRFGIKPLFYSFYQNQFVFASEVTPIVESGLIPKTISQQALDQFFLYGSVSQPNTIYSNISALMPASFLEVNVKNLKHTVTTYYSFVEESHKLRYSSLSYQEAIEIIRSKLEEATRYHLVADVEVGAFLSGGVDSTAVVALMSKYTETPIKTFSVGFAGATEVADETTLARQSATLLGCNHTDIIVGESEIQNLFEGFIGSLDQPSVDGFNTYIVSKAAAKSVKVVLSGLGGDEIFGGYEHFKLIQESSAKTPNILEQVLQKIHQLRPNKYTSHVSLYGQTPSEAIIQQRTLLPYAVRKGLLRKPIAGNSITDHDDLNALQQISKSEINNYLLNTLLRDSDVMSMAHSIECRPILLDHVLVEAAFAMPSNFKIRNGVKKSIFIDAVKDIVPAQVYQRKKTGFEMPLTTWLNKSLTSLTKDALESSAAKSIFSKNYIHESKTLAGQHRLKRHFWQSLVLLCWLNRSKATLP
ncbi:asparagine synthase (glutamine-hydrolyzing) [Ohtaekwangia sp.]|uniref:asparagine synthase (glutamine-hydrolyzing) n=1 Tax=Ohtaekwangia sp. TaxID=2066019 RepID=UPI002FDE5EDF